MVCSWIVIGEARVDVHSQASLPPADDSSLAALRGVAARGWRDPGGNGLSSIRHAAPTQASNSIVMLAAVTGF
jgi:hypothetical protein